MENLKKKLLYQSKNRGTKETDFILGNFAERSLSAMTAHDLEQYAQILQIPDVDLLDYLNCRVSLPDHLKSNVMLALFDFLIVK